MATVGVGVVVGVGGAGVLVGKFVGVAVGGKGVLVAVLVGVEVGGTGVLVGVSVGVAGVSVGVGGDSSVTRISPLATPPRPSSTVTVKIPSAPERMSAKVIKVDAALGDSRVRSSGKNGFVQLYVSGSPSGSVALTESVVLRFGRMMGFSAAKMLLMTGGWLGVSSTVIVPVCTTRHPVSSATV